MNKTPDQTEYPLRTNSVKDTFYEESINNVQHKLHTISSGTGQNDKTIAYKAFLEFIIDNSKDIDPNMHPGNLRLVSSDKGSPEGRSSSKQNFSKVENMLLYVLKEDILDLEDLFHLWKVIRQNTLISHEVLFIGLSKSPNNIRKAEFLEHILSYLSKIPSSEIKLSDCNIIFSIYRICEKSDKLLYRYIDFYEQVLSDDTTSVWMCSNFIKEIGTLIDENRLTAANKIHLLDKYAENINSKLLSFTSVKIIRYLIESCPNTTANKSELSQSECIRFLCKEKSLFNKIITNLGSQVDENIQNSACFDMTEKAQFLVFLTSYIPDYGEMINYDMISSIWETALFIRYPKDLRNQLLKLIKDIPKNGQNLQLEDLDKFFQEKIINCRNILDFEKDEFECFKCLFVLANEYYSNLSEVTLLSQDKKDFPSRFDRLQIRDQKQILDRDLHFENGDFLFQVDAVPNTLKGYKALWNITRLSQDEKVAKLSKDLLINLYTKLSPKLWAKSKEIREEYLNICFEELKGLLVSSRESWKILRCVDLLQAIIDGTDREDNLQGPRSHAQLFKGKLLDITVCDERFRPLKIRAYSKMLVSGLFSEVRRGFSDFKNSLIYLEDGHRKKQITDLQNEKTLSSLGLNERSTWYAFKRNPLEAYLVQYDGTMNPKIREIFIKWFDTFSDNGKMSVQHCAEFIHSVTADECLATDRRVYEFFALHDDNKDCYLTLDNFLSFYLTCCKQRPYVVWSNLLSQELSYDLRQPKEKREQKELGLSSHLCSIISSNKKYIQVLFSLLESKDEIAVKSLQLLNRLPTDPQIFADIVMLKGIRDILDSNSAKPDWSYVLDIKNIYKLFYCLNIVEYLFESKRLGENEEEESEDESEDVKRLWSQGARLVEYKKRWFFDFVACGGFEHLNDVLQKLMMLKTSPTIEVYMTRIKYLMEEIDKVCYHKNNKRIYQDNLYICDS